jgi:peroxiredoxin
MTDPIHGALGPGDRAPDFELPAADVEGRVTLAEHLRRGPVLLTMLRGLYCPVLSEADQSAQTNV